MKFGLFYEQQLPRPWSEVGERQAFHDALDQIELADQLGYDYVWEVEHHFLEEYAHSSAPEVFLGAVTQRTKRIRIGHGVMIMVPAINHPARCAERIATLDILSDGRVEWGFGESSSALELQGFGVAIQDKRAMVLEAVEQCTKMMAMKPYPGFDGRFFSMPCRNVIPKPIQKPHPPLWMACNNVEAIRLAAKIGVGALLFQFAPIEQARSLIEDYYAIIKSDECVPIGYSVNANVCVISALAVHPDRSEAIRRGRENFAFFGRVLKHFYLDGDHQPGFTSVGEMFDAERGARAGSAIPGGVGTPEEVRQHLLELEGIGADQVGFVRQFGRAKHHEDCEELRLLANDILPEFRDRAREKEARKAAELAPFIEAAMRRRSADKPLERHEVPVVMALPKQASQAVSTGQPLEGWERQRVQPAHVTDILHSVED